MYLGVKVGLFRSITELPLLHPATMREENTSKRNALFAKFSFVRDKFFINHFPLSQYFFEFLTLFNCKAVINLMDM